ncbi:hypothetical protein NEMIN01_2160, partial [Nematocida minor]|uniref:uncharacterized protein n=1 Tax=Nematocida minor TaxID=1912983 RepID=UPI00221FA0D1
TIYNLHPTRQNKNDPNRKCIEYLRWEISKIEEKFRKAGEKWRKLGKLNKQKDTAKVRNQKKAANAAKSKEKIKLEALYKELLYKNVSKELDCQAEFVVFRKVNESKSILGAHNEILDVLISRYNLQRVVKK